MSESETFPDNSIYIEYLGNSLFIASLNYERVCFQKNFFYLTGRIGIGCGRLPGLSNFSAPIHINGIFQIYKDLALETGFGITLMRTGQEEEEGGWTHENVAALNVIMGIRFLNKKGVVFRWDFTPLYPINNSLFSFDKKRIQPYFGFSIGRSFGNIKK